MTDDQAQQLVREIGALKQQVAELSDKLERQDDWSSGVFEALKDLTLALISAYPELAPRVMPVWASAAKQYDRLESGTQADDFHETAEFLEARKMLYRILLAARVWPGST